MTEQILEHRNDSLDQILGNEAVTEAAGGSAVYPGRRRGRCEGFHALGEQPEHDPGEHIAAARRRQLRRRVRVDRNPSVGCAGRDETTIWCDRG